MYKLLLNILLISTLGLVLVGCKTKDDPTPSKTPKQLAIEKIAGESSITWVVADGGSVTRNDQSVTNIYQDFELTFGANTNSKTYNTVGGGDIFDSSGNWSFVDNDLSKIILAGTKFASGKEISYTTNGTTDLNLSFSIVAPGADIRMPSAALAGSYRFNLKRKK